MWRGLLGAVQRQSAIELVVFGCGGPVVGKICRVEIVGMGEELFLRGDIIKLVFCDIVHPLEF